MKESESILVVTNVDLGTSPVHVGTVNLLARSGFQVTLAHGRGDCDRESSLCGDIEVVDLSRFQRGRGIWDLIFMVRGVQRLVRDLRIDLLYTMDSWTLPVTLPSMLRWRGAGLRSVYHTFEWLEPGVHKRLHLEVEGVGCRLADLVVCAERTRACLIKPKYRLPGKAVCLPNYLSRQMAVPEYDLAVRRTLLGMEEEPDSVLVVYPTRSSPSRRHKELLLALGALPHRYRLATIKGTGAYQHECETLVRELNLGARVQFLDPVPFSTVLRWVASSDVGVAFYDPDESSGNFMAAPSKLATYVACGVPTLCEDLPGVAAIAYRHDIGVCCDSRHPERIADALIQLAGTRIVLRRRRTLVRHAFESYLNLEDASHDYMKAIRGLCRAS